jgi:hypothetical protein
METGEPAPAEHVGLRSLAGAAHQVTPARDDVITPHLEPLLALLPNDFGFNPPTPFRQPDSNAEPQTDRGGDQPPRQRGLEAEPQRVWGWPGSNLC